MVNNLSWAVIVLVGVVMAVNGACMMVSPRAWFRLPRWIRAQGSITEEQYGSGGWALLLRITGAAILATIAWVIYDSLSSMHVHFTLAPAEVAMQMRVAIGSAHIGVLSIVLGSLAISCAILSGLLLTQQIGEVNRKLPEDRQVPYWGMHFQKYMMIRREYRRLYPNGRIHAMEVGAEIAAGVFFLLALLAAGFFR